MLLARIMSANWDSPAVRALDWGLAALSFAVYLWTWDWLWLVGSILGAASAWYRPLARVQGFVNHMVRRRSPRDRA